MNSSKKLLNLVFKHVSNFIEAHNFKLQQLLNGDYAFYFNSNSKLSCYDWSWRNKKELLLGNHHKSYITYSLFFLIYYRKQYCDKFNITSKEFSSENALKFADMCQCLKDCSCLEELAIKMDIMGI